MVKIATTPYAAGFLLLVDPLYGSQKVIEYLTKLSGQVAGLINCGEGQRVAPGEFELYGMDCGDGEAIRLKSRGAHGNYAIPTDAPFTAYNHLMVPRNSAHPNATKLWINYMLSPGAQTIMYEHELVDHHLVPGSKVAADVEKLKASGATLIEDDVNFALRQDQKEVKRVRTEVQGILQKGVGH